MGVIPLKVKTREAGKKSAKMLRQKGYVPGIFYYKGEAPVPIYCEPMDLREIVYTRATKIIDLEITDANYQRECVLKDVAFHPVTDKIIHFDLMGIKRGQKMTVEIPIVLKGQSIGVRLGGILQHILRKVKITCLPKDLPESIEIDISDLAIGHSLTLEHAKIENFEVDVPLDTVVCSVIPPRVGGESLAAEATAQTKKQS